MKVFLWRSKNMVSECIETDAIDVVTRRYIIRIRISGITVIRKARPKKNLPEEIKIDQDFNLS